MVSTTIIHVLILQHTGRIAELFKRRIETQVTFLCGLESHSCHFLDIPIQSIVA